jgi:hypothetical protein
MRIHLRLIRALPVAVLLLAPGSCSDFLDVNTNPNSPEFANVELRLPALEAQFIHSSYYGENSLWGSEWTQQFSFNRDSRSYAQVHRYELSENTGTSAWDYMYSRPGAGANSMIRDASGPTDGYYRGIGYLFRAWTFQLVTDLWGPVPYVQAFDPTIREPKYDEQQVVYEGIFKDLDSAVTYLSSPTGRRPTTNDLLFAGDVTRWVKLARFLQARAHLRLSNAPGENKVARANSALTALAGGFASNADDADFIYTGGSGARNPLYTFVDLRGTFVAASYLVELLKSRNDPRLPIMFTPIAYDSVRGTGTARRTYPPAVPTWIGHANGASSLNDSTVSYINAFFSADTSRLNVASYADQKFTEAEARLIVTGAAAADVPYRDGIRASMQKMGISTAAINTYLAARPALGTLTNAAALQEIITQKYIANFLKVEPWNDWRRTGYPVLPSPVPNALLPNIPQRIRTPGSELSNNVNQLMSTGIPTGLEGMMVKVWWASGTP